MRQEAHEAKLTPGPWEVSGRRAVYQDVGKVFAPFDAASVGTVTGQVAIVPLDESSLANAHLIAAAPKMYEALATILSDFTNPETIESIRRGPHVALIRQVLIKARGESDA